MGKKLLRILLVLLLIFSLSSVSTNMIRVSKAQVNHDIAVVNVTPSRTLVELRELVNITVVIENQGEESETFNVTLYRETIPIEVNRTIADLTAGQNRTLVFTWNTTDVLGEVYLSLHKEKTYDIKAVATLLTDADQGDNTLTSTSKIKVISQFIAVRPLRTVNQTLTTGKNYTVSIYTDYNGTDVWGWNLRLTYNPAILECIEVVNGDLITAVKDPSAVALPSTINNTLGRVSAGAFFFYDWEPPPPPPTTYGPGTLAIVTFKVVGTGSINITLVEEDTELLAHPNPDIDPVHPVPIINNYTPYFNHMLSGYFSNAITQNIDIAVISVKPSSTSVTQGELVNVTVVIKNQGEAGQTFDVKVYYDYSSEFPGQNIIGIKTLESLAAGANKTFIFAWNTTYAKEGNHIITAIVSGVPGDIDTANNQLDSSETVTVKLEELRPLPITEIIIGVVVIIAIIAVIYFVQRKRRKKPQME